MVLALSSKTPHMQYALAPVHNPCPGLALQQKQENTPNPWAWFVTKLAEWDSCYDPLRPCQDQNDI